jgi:signal transduction histidine kinase
MSVDTAQMTTCFAPAERLDVDAVYRQTQMLLDHAVLTQICESMLNAVAIVNRNRQIVYCNRNFAAFAGCDSPEAVYAKRPGEILDCVYSAETDGGCGTAEACAVCGAVNAIMEAQQDEVSVKEANIRRTGGKEDLNLELKASPMRQGNELFVTISVTDVSDRARRRTLERIFFHDLMNTASALKIILEELASDQTPHPPPHELKSQVSSGITQLIEQIKEQQGLLAAENARLNLNIKPCRTRRLLAETAAYYEHFEIARDRHIIIDEKSPDISFETDQTLIFRVLGNMIKNALEACEKGETVTLSCEEKDGGVQFQVHNPGVIPRKVQLQLFQRSFSTKAEGRGLGTYSMKLLTEHYLGGRIAYTTSSKKGTWFSAWYPLRLNDKANRQ